MDNEAFEVSDEQAQAEDGALSREQYGSGFDTDENASSESEQDNSDDDDYYPGQDDPPPSDDEGFIHYEEASSEESVESGDSFEEKT